MLVADRFAGYVAELHELSDSHRLPHGKPEDLVRLLEAFQNSQIFAADFGCVMRSIVLREHFKASESELLTLVAVAWAGAEPDDSTPQLLYVIQELRGILHKSLAQKVLSRRTSGPTSAPTEVSEEALDVSPDSPDTAPELEKTSPDVQISPPLLTTRDSVEIRQSAAADSISVQRDAPAQDSKSSAPSGASQEPEQAHFGQHSPPREAWERRVTGKKDRRKSSDYPGTYGSSTANEIAPAKRLEPSAAEILAMGLVGLMTALLFSVGSLPVYRARVSVYLPSTIVGATDPRSRDEVLQSGELSEKVAKRLLASPQAKTFLASG
jgi:hypothetical protein